MPKAPSEAEHHADGRQRQALPDDEADARPILARRARCARPSPACAATPRTTARRRRRPRRGTTPPRRRSRTCSRTAGTARSPSSALLPSCGSLKIGSAGSDDRIAPRMPAASAAGSPAARIVTPVFCSRGIAIRHKRARQIGGVSSSMLMRQMSGATPITVNQSAASPCDELEAAADRIGIGPQLLRHRLVDHRDRRAARSPSASVKSRPLRSGRPIVFVECGVVPARKMNGSSPRSDRAAVDDHAAAAAAGVERHEVRRERRFDLRQRSRCGARCPRRAARVDRRSRSSRRS